MNNASADEQNKKAMDCGSDCQPECDSDCQPVCPEGYCGHLNKDSTLTKTVGGLVAVTLIFGAYAQATALLIKLLT